METRGFADPFFSDIDSVVCIGVFDGLHPGHLSIVDQTIGIARSSGSKSVVISFSKNPKMATGSMARMPALQSAREFEEMLCNRGIDYHSVIDFSDDMSKLSGREFIALLCTSYRLRAMVVGSSFRAGCPAQSVGPDQIQSLLSEYTSSAFLKVVPNVYSDGQEVSSSLIRGCLLTGDLEKVSRLLGRAYSLDLRDVSPKSSHNRLFYNVRTLGLLLPKAGRYMVEATEGGASQKGVAIVSEDQLALELPVRMKPDGIIFLGE